MTLAEGGPHGRDRPVATDLKCSNLPNRESLGTWLGGLPSPTLAGWLLAAAERDPILRVVLRCEAAQAAAGGLDREALRHTVEILTAVPDRATWRDADAIGERAGWVVLVLRSALNRGQSAALVGLVELALFRAEQLSRAVQDSEYWDRELHRELTKLHLEACQAALPDPMELALRWSNLRSNSGLGWFDHFPVGYETILGERGLDEFTRLMTRVASARGASMSRVPLATRTEESS